MRRGFQTPPKVLATRAVQQVRQRLDRHRWSGRTGTITVDSLLRQLRAPSIEDLWQRLARRPFPAALEADPESLEELCPGARQRILDRAQRAGRHQVNLLGTGDIALGDSIDWHRDFQVGRVWPLDYFSTIDCCDLDQPSDVKVPWEISRLHWLMPVGQAYLLTRDEPWASTARTVLEQWIAHNPCLYGVNWACTMEAAMRVFVWSWLFHVFQASAAWAEPEFRAAFLTTLFAHAEFVDRYLEITDINGNHCTADAAALVFAGLFFGDGEQPRRWRRRGWNILTREITRQVTADGVDFEGSIPYHRLVCELFLWPALYRLKTGRRVPENYQNRLLGMARFTAAYTRPDGGAPNWGDGDDARVLPFSEESLTDHRYLPAAVGFLFGETNLLRDKPGPLDEAYWMFGQEVAHSLRECGRSTWKAPSPHSRRACERIPDWALTIRDSLSRWAMRIPVRRRTGILSQPRSECATFDAARSTAFRDGGYFVLQNDRDHVFIDGGPVGLSGRGGHGHNDCLSFEATLDGVRLIVDPGSYVYTASAEERNRFRSTAAHNTPQVDGVEINRFLGSRNIWSLGNDAQPIIHEWQTGPEEDTFCGGHTGYLRLVPPVSVRREIHLRHAAHRLEIVDELTGLNGRPVEIPLHLAAGMQVEQTGPKAVRLIAQGQAFELTWDNESQWLFQQQAAWVSPSYGRREPSVRLCWIGSSERFRLSIAPVAESSRDVSREASRET